MSVLLSTDLPFPIFRRGKVRDVYDLGKQLLIVATDRISAFDCVMPEGIPDKGRILTAVAAYWFAATEDLVPNHFRGNLGWPAVVEAHREALDGRAVVVEKTRPLPVECVVRGYLAGSGWKEYQASRAVCGVPLPPGLHLADRLPEPIFTPATKAEEGHDENISFERMAEIVGVDLAARLRDLSLALYRRGAELAAQRGILLADTKFEFGLSDADELILIDEALTPDSSRYWLTDTWAPGKNPPSLDKQFLRDYLETLPGWDKQPPAPHLPPAIIEGIRARYLDLASRFGVAI
jgi:phosphoribosylaminoimidazole-succinocarboxamide synthase